MFRLSVILICSLACIGCCGTYGRNTEGLRYFNQARYDQALVAFQSALAADPNNPDAYYNIAATFHQSAKVTAQTGIQAAAQQQYDDAEKYYRLCLSKDANHTAAYRGLAVLYMERKNPDAAFQLLIGWSQSNPIASEPKIELARLYQEFAQICQAQGRVDEARSCLETTVKMLQQVIAGDPTNFRALRALGYLRELGGDYNNALGDYRLSLQANPKQLDLAAHVAALEQRIGSQGGWNNGTSAPPLSGGGWGSVSQGTGAGATVYNAASQSSYSSNRGLYR